MNFVSPEGGRRRATTTVACAPSQSAARQHQPAPRAAQTGRSDSALFSFHKLTGRPVCLIAAAILLLAASTQIHAGQWPWTLPLTPREQPHPAVVRVNVEEVDGMAHGSGTLVDVRDRFGIVVTNWHVVRDAAGAINVVFSDGFRSAARVLRVDRDWDLAALLIWRPQATPVPIATRAPRPGDLLTIAGYGTGDYRSATGRCTQYVAPSDHHPYEMVEVATSARQGDSGGPILNTSGELAGVLFGSGGGTTSGSYGGRVHQFLSTVWPPTRGSDSLHAATLPDQNRLPRSPQTPNSATQNSALSAGMQRLPESGTELAVGSTRPLAPLPRIPSPRSTLPNTPLGRATVDPLPGRDNQGTSDGPLADAKLPQSPASTFTWQDVAGDSPLQQGKTFLAILGLFTLIAQSSRLFTQRRA